MTFGIGLGTSVVTVGALVAAMALPSAPAATGAPQAGAAQSSGARVTVMVAGRTRVLAGPRRMTARRTSVRASGRRCAVGASTPLAALAARTRARRVSIAVRDFGSCSRRIADAGSLFVNRVGGESNRGRDGWVYKVGHRVGTSGAGDTSGPFGTGRRLRSGQRLTWMWCRMGASGCQRTLEVTSPRRVARGARVRVRVRAFDDRARGVVVRGATVRLGAARATTGADGVAVLPAPTSRGSAKVTAVRSGLVPAFAETVTIR